jgi:hypothetical protein
VAILVHLCAVFVAAVIIVTGTEMILEGPSGFISGVGKSIGGFLVWLILGLVTLPLALVLRHFAGRLPLRPLPVAMGVGVAIGWVLIPVLNPAMTPSLTFASHPVGLLLVYSLAGISGGVVWWAIAFRGVSGKNAEA